MVAVGALGVLGAIIVPPEEDQESEAPASTMTAATAAEETTAAPVETTAPPVIEYPPFDQVDPYLSLYFVTLEDTTLAAAQGEERLYNLGLGVCRNLDRGNTIDQELAGLVDDARLAGGDAASLVGAAVSDLCPHHGQLVEDYLAAN